MVDPTPSLPGLSSVQGKAVIARFDGGRAVGYEDGNDADTRRSRDWKIFDAWALLRLGRSTGLSEPAYSKGYALQKLGAKRIHSNQRWRFRQPRQPLTPRFPKLFAVLPHDRCSRFKPNADAAALVDTSALGGYSTNDILGGQYRCHVAATLTGRLPNQAIIGDNRFSIASLQFTRVIPEIDIWRAANLMLKRYGEKAFDESSARAHDLAADGDHDGASTWRRITIAVKQLANNVPPSLLH